MKRTWVLVSGIGVRPEGDGGQRSVRGDDMHKTPDDTKTSDETKTNVAPDNVLERKGGSKKQKSRSCHLIISCFVVVLT